MNNTPKIFAAIFAFSVIAFIVLNLGHHKVSASHQRCVEVLDHILKEDGNVDICWYIAKGTPFANYYPLTTQNSND